MSKKTMKQRIALVAVSTLTAGVLSVVSTPAANATAAAGASGVILVSGSICGATSLIGGAPLEADGGADASPFESGAAGGKVITMPVGGILTVAYDVNDLVTVSGPLSIQSLTDGTTASTTSIINGKVVVTGGGADGSFALSASSVGAATLVVDTATADATPSATNTIKVTIVATCASTGVVAATSFISVEDTSVAVSYTHLTLPTIYSV